MRLLVLLHLLLFVASAQSILLMNSSDNVEKYNQAATAFKENFHQPIKMINISDMNTKEIKKYLYDEYPDIIYTIGSKSYQYANRYLPEKTIFFSSIVNWKRLPLSKNQYGISNEVYSGMQLTLIKSIFPKISSIGVIYSKYTKNIVDSLKMNAQKLGIKIVAQEVNKESVKKKDFQPLLKETQALILISDPVLLSEQEVVKDIFKESAKLNKAIFAYHQLFINYGALLTISVDNPTIGRQMATTITDYLQKQKISKVQYPIGTKVIFNKRVADKLGISYNENISFLANEIVE